MDKPAPISGYRSRAINAVADFAASVAPVAGPGIHVEDTAAGKLVGLASEKIPARPAPWTVRVVPTPSATDSAAVEWVVRVWAGLAMGSSGALAAPTADGTDPLTGLDWHDAPAAETGAPWLCVVESAGAWSLAWKSLPAGPGWRAIAKTSDDTPPRVVQFDLGVVDLGSGGGGVDPGPGGDEVAKVLGGDDYNANADTWEYGDVDEATGLPTYPVFNPSRVYWHEPAHTLYSFRRTVTHNAAGLLVRVSAEVREIVFTAVPEMP